MPRPTGPAPIKAIFAERSVIFSLIRHGHSRIHITLKSVQLPASSLYTGNQQRAFRLEGAKMLRVSEPPPRVNFRRRRRINDAFVSDILETSRAEQFGPFLARKKMRGYRQQISPMVAVRIVAVVVDEDPRRPALVQHAKNISEAGSRIGPVIR